MGSARVAWRSRQRGTWTHKVAPMASRSRPPAGVEGQRPPLCLVAGAVAHRAASIPRMAEETSVQASPCITDDGATHFFTTDPWSHASADTLPRAESLRAIQRRLRPPFVPSVRGKGHQGFHHRHSHETNQKKSHSIEFSGSPLNFRC